MYIHNMKYKTEQEKKEAKRKCNREYYYRETLKTGKIPKPLKNKQTQQEREQDLRELVSGLRHDIKSNFEKMFLELKSELMEIKSLALRLLSQGKS